MTSLFESDVLDTDLFAMDTQLNLNYSVPITSKDLVRVNLILNKESIKLLEKAKTKQERSYSWIVRDLILKHLK